jgi:3-deoxy-D-manno-octulosonic-acid transferase
MKFWSSTYKLLTTLGAPIIGVYLMRRRAEGREDTERFAERLGFASRPQPDGRLVWCHAASVGEAASLMSLIEKLRDIYPMTHVLVTTGTVTSAKMLEGRLPKGVLHQYVPVDRLPYVRRFLDHWQPDLVLWIESELWPNMLSEIKERGIPAVLLNGRMSEKSFYGWYKVKSWAKEILSAFVLCLAQTEEERSRFMALGAKNTQCFGNLKYTAKPLACDEESLTALKHQLAGRLIWVMASTHRGEDEIAVAAHKQLRSRFPNLLTIIAPRHAARGGEIADKLKAENLKTARRSKGEMPAVDTQIYLADTMGELGLFYRLSAIACVGGSFVPIGGHNLIEPAQLGCAILFGPHMYKTEMTKEFLNQQAAIQLQNGNELAFTLERLFSDPDESARYAQTARILADQKRHVLDQVMHALEPWLRDPLGRVA